MFLSFFGHLFCGITRCFRLTGPSLFSLGISLFSQEPWFLSEEKGMKFWAVGLLSFPSMPSLEAADSLGKKADGKGEGTP